MNGRTPCTESEPLLNRRRTVPGCRLCTHDGPPLGRVVQVQLSGRQDPEFWEDVRALLREEIPRSSPRFLVFDIRGLDCIVGSALLGGLVAGAMEMKKLGRFGATRIVAMGEIATRLARSLALCKLEPVLGSVHGDLESALARRN